MLKPLWPIPLVAISLLSTLDAFASSDDSATDVDFDRDIRSLLSDRCFACHGPDEKNRRAKLRLDQEGAAKKKVVVPGDASASELFRRLTSSDPDERMPPPEAKRSLSTKEIETIRRWIDAGAPWSEHWSFRPLAADGPPNTSEASWPLGPIDQFVLDRLRRENLRPAPEASRERLIRRVTFDLTGLPPTIEEIDAFLADDSPTAYEDLVDRLLRSPRYGEHLAASWLDVARYSDTYGYQVDRERFVWPWRDWVIRAFSDNMPYDQFITEQLAGDLLEDATDDQILATTFQRLHPQKVEGGSTPEEFRVEYVADRTETFGTAFLGLSMGCARCHDHKYDPITQKEYYQLFSFFSNIDEAGLYSYFTRSVPTPTLRLVDDATKSKIASVEQRIETSESRRLALEDSRRAAFEEWLANGPASGDERPSVPGRTKHLDFEASGHGANRSVPGRVGRAVQLTGDDGIGVGTGNFRRYQPFSVALWLNTPDEKERAVVFHRSRAWTDAGSRGYQLLIEDGYLSASLIHFWPGNAIRVRTREKIRPGEWTHVVWAYDGSSRASGLRLYLNGKPAPLDIVKDKLTKNISGGGGDNITIGERFRDRGFTRGLVDEFEVFDRELTAIEAAHVAARGTDRKGALASALETSPDTLDSAQRTRLFEFYLATVDPEAAAWRNELLEIREERSELVDGLREIMVMRELETPRVNYLLDRGRYDARAEPVEPRTPESLPPFPTNAPRNRLGLARWLTSPDHPLAARVAVNRFWQLMFGRGFVRTPEDFGTQGARPTHPELLDWLARDFVSNGWDVRRLLRQVVLSATYRQDSRVDAATLEVDPENRLLARAPSYRLSAEMLRDNALAVSGLLSTRVGGAPAKPYDLQVSFKPINHDKGEGLYRRSVYTYWKRTAPAPALMTLDASKRDVCRMRRERTASPLQAFIVLNGPQFVEASRVLAGRVLDEFSAADDAPAALVRLFRTLTSRRPTTQELRVLETLHGEQLAYFASHPDRAKQLLEYGHSPVDGSRPAVTHAALTVVANTLMNFDECVTKR